MEGIHFGGFKQWKMKKVYRMSFAKIYPLLVNKAVKKGRTVDEVNAVISWLTGYKRGKT